MRLFSADSEEFESPSSEEFVVIAVGNSRYYKNFNSFYRKTKDRHEFKEFDIGYNENFVDLKEYTGFSSMRSYIAKFSGISVRLSSKAIVLSHEWDVHNILIHQYSEYIRYLWYTTA